MQIRTLLFAVYRDMAGTGEILLELGPGATAGDLVRLLRAEPGMDRLPEEPALAVNHEYAPLSTVLTEGDEVALLPPVAGG
jgi:molybdopterin converting factor small subunit